MLEIAAVRMRLHYEPLTGFLTWRSNDRRAGSLHPSGYRCVTINQRWYLEHRIVWFYVRGEYPSFDLDHINGIKSDNRIDNLRPCNDSQNQGNARMIGVRNTSGFRGVCFDKKSGKWQAGIRMGDRACYLGQYDRIENAAQAYLLAAAINWGEFARPMGS